LAAAAGEAKNAQAVDELRQNDRQGGATAAGVKRQKPVVADEPCVQKSSSKI
jgi:hypothetical protein